MVNKRASDFNNTTPVNFSHKAELGNIGEVENPYTGVLEPNGFTTKENKWAAPRTLTITQKYQLEQAGHTNQFQIVVRGRVTDTSLTHAKYDGTVYRIADLSVDQRNYYSVLTIITLEKVEAVGNE